MNEEKINGLILEYISSETRIERKEEIKSILEDFGYDLTELQSLDKVYKKIDELPVPEPSNRMDQKFYSLLDKQKSKKSLSVWDSISNFIHLYNAKRFAPKLAYAMILVFIGIGIGQWILPQSNYENQIVNLSREVYGMKEVVMLSMLNQASPTERIRAVNSTNEMTDVDNKIIKALLSTLNNDPNVNVRLVTIEALSKFADKPEVREGLILSITKQTSPVVQLELAELMVVLQEKGSVESLQNLLKQKDLNDVVRTNIKKSISKLI